MNRRKTVVKVLGIVALLLGLVGIGWTVFGITTVSMSETQIQTKIDEKMPIEQKGVRISNVQVDLSNNKINLTFDAATKKKGVEVEMSVATVGTMRYDQSRGSFYFEPEDVKLSHFQANGKSISEHVGAFADKVKSTKEKVDPNGKVTQKVGKFLDKWVDTKRLIDNREELTEDAAKLVQELIQTAAAAALHRIPVHTLKDDFKGVIIRAALESVEVKDHKVIAHLSLLQLTATFIGYILLVLLGVALLIILVACPELAFFLG